MAKRRRHKIVQGLIEAIDHPLMPDEFGLHEAWDGKPAGVAKFLAFAERKVFEILMGLNQPKGVASRLQVVHDEIKSAREFLDGYVIAMLDAKMAEAER